ncbi:MAG: DegV protein [Acidimicrobiaceae bacterium]|nr:DegV protein [Acidimicrobiaceae bacterium]
MGRVVVVTDASTGIPRSLAEALSIAVLPITAEEDGDPDSEDDASSRLSESAEADELDAANRPFVTAYLEAVEQPGVDAAVVVTPAVEFASMFRNAVLAAELAGIPAVAVDSRTASAGQALVVLAGAEAAARGEELPQVVRTLESAVRRVELVASLATLEPIRRSGPLPAEVLGPPELEGGRSVFRMRSGAVEPLGATASGDEALVRILDAFKESGRHGVERVAIFHAGAPELAARLGELLGEVDFVAGFSRAMQVHTGRGVVGAAWLARDAPGG